MNSKSKSLQTLKVVLGTQAMKAFVAAPKEFNVLGIVRMGMEFGLLATTASGSYVRVNGSLVRPLDARAVEEAIQLALTTGRGESYATTRRRNTNAAEGVTAPVVQHKRRRYVELPAFNTAPAVNTSMQVDVA
ncbi:hypothetical protein [Rhodoferax sp. GW822-FHT02A01]|uniref:hypothetical protein n=1 Tax=Rhodoferax sp. GW822-FHT02A01 TaxID=3141537 RepID=UPI00315C9D4D